VLFAVEELGSVHALSQRALLLAFAGSFTASFVLKSWNIYGSNQLTVFALSTSTNSPGKEWQIWEISLFLLLGIIGGLVGSLFIWLNLRLTKRRRARADEGMLWMLPSDWQQGILRRLPAVVLRRVALAPACGLGHQGAQGASSLAIRPCVLHVSEAMIIASITAALNYPFTHLLRMPMVEVIHGLFETCPHTLGRNLGLCDATSPHGFSTSPGLETALLFAAVVRLTQTAITFGAMIPSGLFIPSLYIGAALGRAVGLWTLDVNLQLFGEHGTAQVNPSVFAMVGAVAMLSGFARMTVSLVVIMLELTGELNYVVPFMCAVLAAKLVGDCFTVSIYDGHAALAGFATIEEPEGLRLAAQVTDVAIQCSEDDIIDISRPISVEALRSTLQTLPSSPNHVTADHRSGPSILPSCAVPRDHASEEGASDVIVVIKGCSEGEVCGVLRREHLHEWLEKNARTASALCTFDPDGRGGDHLPPLLDASDLVEVGIRRLLGTAPILTAVCAFREYPDLDYCVCRCESDRCRFSVLSRQRLEDALSAGRFAAGFGGGGSMHHASARCFRTR